MSEIIDLMKLIQTNFHKLSKGQRIIAQFIMNNYDKAAFLTAAKLGEMVGVSESTVVRFANAIGYSGYPQLQKQLQELIKSKLTTVQRIEMTSGYSNDDTILKNVLKSDIDNIRTTMEELDYKNFEQAVKNIREAKTIYILGLRSSTALAEFLGFYLNHIRDNINVVTYTIGDIFEQLFRIDENDLVIAMGFPRYSSRTIKALEYSKAMGAKTLAITDSMLSPLCSYADNILIAKSNMESFVDSIVAPLSVLNALIVAVGIKEKEKLSLSFSRLEEIWDKYSIFAVEEEK
jgi:DNA-binding MurR/RpiR family transcriptional regulator